MRHTSPQAHSNVSADQHGQTTALAQPLGAERFSMESVRLEESLQAAGVCPESLMREWGVRLWSLRVKRDKIKLKLEACRPVDELALTQWFWEKLGRQKPVAIQISPISKCCFSPCDGCLVGNPGKRPQWLGISAEAPPKQ